MTEKEPRPNDTPEMEDALRSIEAIGERGSTDADEDGKNEEGK